MNIHNIIKHLRKTAVEYRLITSFSQKPGIYAVIFVGKEFPLQGNPVAENDIVYIGKTESSQEKRDAKTHFTSGKTGSSTLRKSIGSLLCQLENLVPVPRNDIDFKKGKGRKSHFKFDSAGEEKITQWMRKNLALSFFEFEGPADQLEALETALINELVPVLNISKNPRNPYRETIQQMRKKCAMMAAKNAGQVSVIEPVVKSERKKRSIPGSMSSRTSGKYIPIWMKYLSEIEKKLEKLVSRNTGLQSESVNLAENLFTEAGNRKSYAFNLEIIDGRLYNNIGGSAVARDLYKVLGSSKKISALSENRHFKFRMDSSFVLWICLR